MRFTIGMHRIKFTGLNIHVNKRKPKLKTNNQASGSRGYKKNDKMC